MGMEKERMSKNTGHLFINPVVLNKQNILSFVSKTQRVITTIMSHPAKWEFTHKMED